MRVCTVSHSYCVRANRGLARALAASSTSGGYVHAIGPATFRGDLRPIEFEAELLPDANKLQNLYSAEGCKTRLGRWIHLMSYGADLRTRLGERWDLVHAWEEPYILSGWQLGAWTPPGTPFVFSTFQNLPKRYPPPFNWFEQTTVRRCAGWIAFGKTIQKTMLARPGYAAKPNTVIPPGIDCAAFKPDAVARDRVRGDLDWNSVEVPVVGYLGRFVEEKGLRLLMRALEAQTTPWRALFVGGGAMEGELRGWGEGFRGRVRVVTGAAHDDVPAYLAAMDVLCAPSQTTGKWREQFGRMLVEAQSCGVCVLGSDSGEIPHTIGGAGMVLPESDTLAWEKVLGQILADPELRRELGELGREQAMRRFDWSVVAAEHWRFFQDVGYAHKLRQTA